MNLKLAKNSHKDMLSNLIKASIKISWNEIGNVLDAILIVFNPIILCSIYNKNSLILIQFLSILGFLLLKIILN